MLLLQTFKELSALFCRPVFIGVAKVRAFFISTKIISEKFQRLFLIEIFCFFKNFRFLSGLQRYKVYLFYQKNLCFFSSQLLDFQELIYFLDWVAKVRAFIISTKTFSLFSTLFFLCSISIFEELFAYFQSGLQR